MIDKTTLAQVSKSFDIDEFSVLREYLQVCFLEKFYQNPNSVNTFFKGGTAIKLLFGSRRFSEDLNFTTKLDEKSLKQVITRVKTSLLPEFPNLTVKELDTFTGYSAKLYLPTEISSQDLTIKLDFSQRENVLEKMSSPLETLLPTATTAVVEHLSAREILSEKIRALTERTKGRDLFDLWYLLSKQIPLNISFVKKKFAYYQEDFSVKSLVEKVEKWPEKEIDSDLRRFLPVSDRKIIPELKRLVLEKLKGNFGKTQ